MTTADQSLVKIYSDRTYTHTTMVRHQGTVIAFAMDSARRIVYTVLDLSSYDAAKGELDASYWSENPAELPFPAEVVRVGYALLPATGMPVVKKGGRTEAGPDDELDEEETDRFLSTTARLTAAAPFQVLSDGSHVVLLRQAIDAAHPDGVFTLTDGGASGDLSRTDFLTVSGTKVPLVADTLLCDRFLLAGGALKPVGEVRFKRSRHKSEPESTKDSLGAFDMDGRPFHEPTQELGFIRNLSQGRFTAVLTPTSVQGQQRWQFFAHNKVTGRIDSFNVEQDADGLFNTQGTQYWTSPDARYRASVYERDAGTCPFTGLALVPVVPDSKHAETALRLNGTNASVDLGTGSALKFQGRPYAVEAWICPQAAGGPVVSRWSGSGQGGFQLRVTATGQVILDHSGGSLTATQTVQAGAYAHVAASFDGKVATLYVNGVFSGNATLPYPQDGTASLRVGAAQSGGFFNGVIDEVRIWNRARAQAEITDERVHRLIGNEPGLAAYYRLDEGVGTTAYDQTDTAAHATITGTATWVTSQAPVGDHPGVRRDSFTLSGRDVVSGLAACLYYQQEKVTSGYAEAAKPAKRQARVLLACATRPSATATADAHIATVDFGVGVDGRLADIPDVLTLNELGRPVEETADRVSAQERLVTQLEQQARVIENELTALRTEKAQLESEVAAANAGAEASNDPTKWAVWMVQDMRYYLGIAAGDPLLRLTQTYLPTVRWQIMVVPGATPRFGNPVVALVCLDHQERVLEPKNGSTAQYEDLVLVQRSLTAPLPATAQWYIDGHMQIGVRFQNVHSGLWIADSRQSAYGANTLMWQKEGIAPDLQIRVKTARIAEITALVAQRTVDLAAKQAEIALARDELARLTGGLLGSADLVLSVPHGGVDATGLSSAGAVLKFARTATGPCLMDSAAGRVALYFQGANGQFFAAYLDTNAVRGVQQLTGGGQTALFTARDPGVDLATGTVITVANCTVNNAVAAGLCDLTVTRGTETETFTRLPRRARDLAAAVNGAPEDPIQLGVVASVSGDQVRLTQALAAAVPSEAYVRIGTATHQVVATAAAGANTLRVTPSPSAGTTAGTGVSQVRYDTGRATASRPGVSLAEGSRWITVSADAGDLPVPNGTATVRVTGYGARWRGDSPGRAFSFDGAAHRLALPDTQLDRVTTPAGDLTVETWAAPGRIPGTRARLLHLNRDRTKAALTLVPGDPVAGGMLLDGSNDAMLISGASPTQTDFTIECWLKRATGRTVVDTIVSCVTNGLTMGFTADGKFSFGFGTGTAAQTLTTPTATTDGEWHHWAVTFDRTSKVQIILRDGMEVARRTATGLPGTAPHLIVGRTDTGTTVFFSGRLAELRTWNTARSAADIHADRFRRLPAGEPGLAGAWIYEKSRLGTAYAEGQLLFTDLSGNNRHGGVWGDPATADSALTSYRVQAAFGEKARAGRESYPSGDWAHLAAVYEESYALRFDGSSWAQTSDADALDISGDLTLEVFAKIDAIGTRQGLLSKGRLGDGSGGSVPYQLTVLPSGKLEFAFEEPGPVVKRFTSSTALTAGFHRIAVVRRAGRTSQEVKGTRAFPVTDASGTTTTRNVDVVERVDVEEWRDITFVVNGNHHGTTRYTGPGPRGNDGALEIGHAQDGTSRYPLTGTIGEVRIWGKARETDRLGTPVQPRDEALLARWTFEENDGNTTADLIGGFDLKLRGARWTTDPDPRASAFTLYRNGRAVPADIPATHPLTEWGDDQLTLGALKKAGTHSDFYAGVLEEVRLWRTARTPEQLLDSLFTRLKGDKQDLLGYWPFDADSTTATAEAVRDQSLRGNHLDIGTDTTRPRIILSTAPVSTDTAAVRSALAGIRTPFHETISRSPAASEYADLQYTATGESTGVLKRCYTHLKDGTWHLTTGYKVGDLITEWVSQVQFDPQLIGYIEGAPPVPSENLTGGTDPAGCSSVTFQQAEEVTSTLSSSSERSVSTSFDIAAGLDTDAQVLLLTAPLGFGTAQPLASVTVKARVGGSLEFSNAWTDETSVSQGTSTERDTTATLTGTWEDPTRLLNDTIGRRYVPANTGYALVQSETADVYALRLAHTGALVAYRMQPNPDIPKDWNILSFPLNPQYTKQGTLDGTVGFGPTGKVTDPAYPGALQRGEYSYFKPREAYAIKRRILRERQQLESYYADVSTGTGDTDPTSERAKRLLESFAGSLPPAPDKPAPTRTQDAFANRNIANTYVWTADGGFFAETTGTVDVVTQTTGGSYSLSGAVSLSLEVGFEIAGIGAGVELDASVGGGITTTRNRTKESTRTHSLEVECNPTRDLQQYNNGQPVYNSAGKPVLTPGKVDAYRFMTFYLAQDSAHFDDFYHKVADPLWLAGSKDANAAALRQARQSDRKPPCWRILHRVTYISRVLPPVPPTGAPPLEQALTTVDIPSNYELIRRLDPYTSTATGSISELADATRVALTAHLPQLLPHTTDITQFLAAYYGITD
ncbi:LamG domain-containing protein [Streptomyces yaizuensis]|uniref:Laminin G domain-containing protein n=1 Tax=Streptomyces yaizuensis TaxID=2989713 RepID=A0ABQ5NS20_9ACTN|nr:LamG domain-containing protein [Streptomyces sp. YSPA8]GLF92945.1 laminin G domain-containing protein [Streptomyces sp. YSPA8]